MPEFAGTERYELLRRLGAGGMGIVYEVFDRTQRRHVALKTLTRVDPAGIYDLKQEFRSLADVRHPNVVSLYEIVSDEDQWFFTMELVLGTTFLEHVAPAVHRDREQHAEHVTTGTRAPDDTRADQRGPARAAFDERRLRAALTQLVEGVGAIHAATKLHRDLKPSNVLVTAEGRVVVLDFGLVQSHGSENATADTSLEGNLVVGTPAYMAPEQAAGKRATPASDWYAVGVMLYHALTGTLPFAGSLTELLLRKQTEDVTPPSARAVGVPEDLERLALHLLERDPGQRAGEKDLHRALRLVPPSTQQRASLPARRAFVGRARELTELEEALARSRRGVPQCVFLCGESGRGKTALVNHFLERERDRSGALVLSGRSYPREALPYRAFDAIVDGLTRWIGRLPESAASELLPRNRRALTSLFPVLQRVAVMDAWDSLALLPEAPAQRRERAFAAFKDLLGRISDQGPLILHLDNLEWGDADSAELLEHLCSAPDPPAMLVIGTHRPLTEPEGFLARLPGAGPRLGDAERRDLELLPLSPAEAASLCELSLGDAGLARRFAMETQGDPLLIELLCARPDQAPTTLRINPTPSVDELLAGEIDRASHAARGLLRVLAISGAPLSLELSARAAGLSENDGRAGLAELLRRRLVELTQHREGEAWAPSHDRIVRAVLAGWPAKAQANASTRLAEALAREPTHNPEALAHHFARAGDTARALRYMLRAAARAERSLAFEHAARLYALARDLCQDDDARSKALLGLAEAYLQLGDPGRAATTLLAAADLVSDGSAGSLRRRAASLRLTDAQIDALFGEAAGAESLFHGVGRERVQTFLSRGQIIEASRGEVVARRSDPVASVLVVLAGELAIAQSDGEVTIATGEVLGVLSLLQGTPGIADVRATRDGTRILSITRQSLDDLSEAEPRLALQLTVNLARILCGRLVNVHARAFAARPPDGAGNI